MSDLIRTASPLISSVKLFDVYTGERIPQGKKSLAYSIEFVSPERTLKDEEVEEEISKIVRLLEERTGAKLRGG
ncbi:hypothetical protein DRP77_11020 [Candidatus Poribacteria bacterium]|nr:MAG: hypothetical protein DRP77_11020 [Candidatus Poribacteria bacterium]